MTKEIIFLHVGQAGIQISNAQWELFCIEHGLDCQGNTKGNSDVYKDEFFSGINIIFQEAHSEKYVPRAINIDLEPTVIDEIRLGPYRHLWHPDMLMSGLEDASNNFARGFYSVGKKKINEFIEQLTKLVRDCSSIHGFVIVNSYGGGTGSGFSNLILNYLNEEFTKNTKIGSVIFPSPKMATAVVEPYNSILSAVTSIEDIDLSLLYDNEAMFESCYNKIGICKPTYSNINRLVSQILSSLTVTLRFGSSLDHDLVHFQTNLIPYPKMHFPFANISPINDHKRVEHKKITTVNITYDLFDPGSQLINCDLSDGKYMSCCLHYRGYVLPREVNQALGVIKNRSNIQFVDWCPTGFKVGISSMPPSVVSNEIAMTDKNCALFGNSSSIAQVWDRILSKFNFLYKKQSFVHWYVGEGMELSEFEIIREKIVNLQRDYEEVCEVTPNESTNKNRSNKKYFRDSVQANRIIENNINCSQAIVNLTDINMTCLGADSIGSSSSHSLLSIDRRNEIRHLLKTLKVNENIQRC